MTRHGISFEATSSQVRYGTFLFCCCTESIHPGVPCQSSASLLFEFEFEFEFVAPVDQARQQRLRVLVRMREAKERDAEEANST